MCVCMCVCVCVSVCVLLAGERDMCVHAPCWRCVSCMLDEGRVLGTILASQHYSASVSQK